MHERDLSTEENARRDERRAPVVMPDEEDMQGEEK